MAAAQQKTSSMSGAQDWPPSLQAYVAKCFDACVTNEQKDMVEIALKGKISSAVSSSSLWSRDWAAEELPRCLVKKPVAKVAKGLGKAHGTKAQDTKVAKAHDTKAAKASDEPRPDVVAGCPADLARVGQVPDLVPRGAQAMELGTSLVHPSTSLVLVRPAAPESALASLRAAAELSKLPLAVTTVAAGKQNLFAVTLGGREVARGKSKSKAAAAALEAVAGAPEVALARRQVEVAAAVGWTEVMASGGRTVAEGPSPLGKGCRGFTLLGRLGWREGSGLGRGGEGRREPVRAEVGRVGREGLGYTARGPGRGRPEVEAFVLQHLQQAGLGDLVLGPGLVEEQEKVVRSAAGRLKVRVKEVKAEEATYLVVCGMVGLGQVVEELHRREEGATLHVGGTSFTLTRRAVGVFRGEEVREDKARRKGKGELSEVRYDYYERWARWRGGRVQGSGKQEVTEVGKNGNSGVEKNSSSDENHNYISDNISASLLGSGFPLSSKGKPSVVSLLASPLVGATGSPPESCEQCLEGQMEEAVRRMRKVVIL